MLSQSCDVTGTNEVAPLTVSAEPDPNGNYSFSVYSTNDLTPQNTFYTATARARNGVVLWQRTIQVPQTAGPFEISTLETNPPTASPTPAHVSALTVDGAAQFNGAATFSGTETFNTQATMAAGLTAAGPVTLGGGPWFDAMHPSFAGGAKFDGKQVNDATVVLNQATVVLSASDILPGGPVPGGFHGFAGDSSGLTDVGKAFVLIAGAITAGTIVSVQSATQATMSVNAGASTGAAIFEFSTDDSVALQAFWTKIVAGNGRTVTGPGGCFGLLPMGMSLITAPISTDQQALGSFKLIGAGKGAATGHCTVIKAASTSAFTSSPMLNVPNLRSGTFRDFSLDGNFIAQRCFQAVEGTPGPPPAQPSGETSTFNRFEDVYFANALDYQIYLDGTEDTMFWGAHFPAAVNLDHNSVFINAPGGQFSFTDCGLMGVVNLNFQICSAYGSTIGPLVVNNPSSLATLAMTLVGCYMYDSANHYCLQAADRFTDIVAIGCFLIASVKFDWVHGQIILGVTLKFSTCGFLQSGGLSGQNAPIYMVTADGAGAGGVAFDTCSSSAFGSFTNANRHSFRNINGATADCIAYNSFSNSFGAPDSYIVGPTLLTGLSGTWLANTHAFAIEVHFDPNGATVTGLDISPDGGTTIHAVALPFTIAGASFMVRPGHSWRPTFSVATPKASYFQAA